MSIVAPLKSFTEGAAAIGGWRTLRVIIVFPLALYQGTLLETTVDYFLSLSLLRSEVLLALLESLEASPETIAWYEGFGASMS